MGKTIKNLNTEFENSEKDFRDSMSKIDDIITSIKKIKNAISGLSNIMDFNNAGANEQAINSRINDINSNASKIDPSFKLIPKYTKKVADGQVCGPMNQHYNYVEFVTNNINGRIEALNTKINNTKNLDLKYIKNAINKAKTALDDAKKKIEGMTIKTEDYNLSVIKKKIEDTSQLLYTFEMDIDKFNKKLEGLENISTIAIQSWK